MKSLHIRQLTTRFITRDNAVQAVNTLALDKPVPKNIDLDDVLVFSYPFLDELILQASKADLLMQITFYTDDESTLDKLAYISATRHVDINVSGLALHKYRLPPKTFTWHKAILIANKEKPNKEPDQEPEKDQS